MYKYLFIILLLREYVIHLSFPKKSPPVSRPNKKAAALKEYGLIVFYIPAKQLYPVLIHFRFNMADRSSAMFAGGIFRLKIFADLIGPDILMIA